MNNEEKISKTQLENALLKQKERGKRLGQILIDENIITENEIIDFLEKQL